MAPEIKSAFSGAFIGQTSASRETSSGGGTEGNAPKIDWLPSTKITDSSVMAPAARMMCSSWARVMGELPHDSRALGRRQDSAKWRILAQCGTLVGVGKELGTKRRPPLLQTLLPSRPQSRVRPAGHVLGEALNQSRIRIDLLNRSF